MNCRRKDSIFFTFFPLVQLDIMYNISINCASLLFPSCIQKSQSVYNWSAYQYIVHNDCEKVTISSPGAGERKCIFPQQITDISVILLFVVFFFSSFFHNIFLGFVSNAFGCSAGLTGLQMYFLVKTVCLYSLLLTTQLSLESGDSNYIFYLSLLL